MNSGAGGKVIDQPRKEHSRERKSGRKGQTGGSEGESERDEARERRAEVKVCEASGVYSERSGKQWKVM